MLHLQQWHFYPTDKDSAFCQVTLGGSCQFAKKIRTSNKEWFVAMPFDTGTTVVVTENVIFVLYSNKIGTATYWLRPAIRKYESIGKFIRMAWTNGLRNRNFFV